MLCTPTRYEKKQPSGARKKALESCNEITDGTQSKQMIARACRGHRVATGRRTGGVEAGPLPDARGQREPEGPGGE